MVTKAEKRAARERRLATKEKHKLKLSPLETDLLGRLLTEEAWAEVSWGGDIATRLLAKIEKVAGKTWPASLPLADDTDLTNEDLDELVAESAELDAKSNFPVAYTSSSVFVLKSTKGVIHYQQNPFVFLTACGRYFNDHSVADNEGLATDVTCGSCKKTLRNEGLLPRD